MSEELPDRPVFVRCDPGDIEGFVNTVRRLAGVEPWRPEPPDRADHADDEGR